MRTHWMSLCRGSTAAMLIVSAGVARADHPAKTIDLHGAVALALAHNADARSADEDVRVAEGGLTQSRAFENPSLFLAALGTNLSPLDAPIPNQVGVTWTLPLGGKRAAGIAGARADVDVARAGREAARRQLALDVSTAFVAVLVDGATLDFAQQDEAALAEAGKVEAIRYADGKIAYGDVLKLRIQAAGAADAVHQAELTLASDRAELARLCGEGALSDDFAVEGALAAPTLPDTTATALLAQALAHRSDYQALLAGERSAAAAVDQARRQPIPDLGILADYNHVPGEAGSFDLSLSASIPLFDRNQGATQQAEAGRRKAHLATESLRGQIRADALRAAKGWATSRARLKLYDDDLIAAAKESLEISRHAYEQGRGSLLDYLDAEASYREVESAYRTAVAEAMLAAAQLRFVAGEDLP